MTNEVRFSRETLDQIINSEGVKELTKLHKQEMKVAGVLDPDIDQYKEYEDSDSLRCFTCRVNEVLVGYATFMLGTSLIDRNSVSAYQDNIFIHPAHRGIGLKFIKYCETELSKEVSWVYFSVNPAYDWSMILRRRGYSISNTIYGKQMPQLDNKV